MKFEEFKQLLDGTLLSFTDEHGKQYYELKISDYETIIIYDSDTFSEFPQHSQEGEIIDHTYTVDLKKIRVAPKHLQRWLE